jgi:hypothetical protein
MLFYISILIRIDISIYMLFLKITLIQEDFFTRMLQTLQALFFGT